MLQTWPKINNLHPYGRPPNKMPHNPINQVSIYLIEILQMFII